MPSEKTNAKTRDEWKELGFYYEYDDELSSWIFVGSIPGLQRFSDLIRQYSMNSKNEGISEHVHLGPYMYLEIITWTSPDINKHGIFGSLQDLRALATLIRDKLSRHRPLDEFSIWREYSPQSESHLIFKIRERDFDPSSADDALKADTV